jgi:Mn2+/Fe2+ NRAMP family transporter
VGGRREGSVERAFLVACLFYVAYVVAGVMAKPDWGQVARDSLVPTLPAAEHRTAWLLMLVGLVGTTVSPWMQFYQQSAVAEKGTRIEQLRYSTVDTVFGGLTVLIVAGFVVVACSRAFPFDGPPETGHRIGSAADAAMALVPVAGAKAEILFAAGLMCASVFAASILPLSTAFSVCEGLGFETGVNKRVPEAPFFYFLYGLLLLLGACVVFVPERYLVRVMFYSQVVNGLVLPFVLFFIIRLVRDRRVMGEYANGPVRNAVAWTVSGAVSLLTLVSLAYMTGLAG